MMSLVGERVLSCSSPMQISVSSAFDSTVIFTWLIPWWHWKQCSQPLDATKSLGLSTSNSLYNFWAWIVKTGQLIRVPARLSFKHHVKTTLSCCGYLAVLAFFLFIQSVESTTHEYLTLANYYHGHASLWFITHYTSYHCSFQDLWHLRWKHNSFYR